MSSEVLKAFSALTTGSESDLPGLPTWNLHPLKLYVAVGGLHGFQDPLEFCVSDAAE